MTQSKVARRVLVAIGAALAALLVVAPVASAAETNPNYEQFSGCPTPAESSETPLCIRSDISGGHLQVGSKDVPIKETLTLSGGVDAEFEGFTAGPEGGLSPVKQEVPGGIIGLTGLDWLINFLNLEGLKLYAITELAGTPSNFNISTVTVPVKVHLINPILGNNCYIGSVGQPVTLDLITGTTEPPPPNEPITGVFPEITTDEELFITSFSNGTFVDNSFSAPGASGCVLTLFGFIPISINGLVNSTSGLPAAAGTNEAVQEFDIELAPQALVYGP